MVKTIFAFFQLIRIVNLCIIALGLCLFYWFVIEPVHYNILHTTLLPFNQRDFILFVLSVILVAAGGNIINDYYDFELDREFKPARPLTSGVISLNAAIYLHGAFMLGGVALGFYLGWGYGNFKIGYLYVICALSLYAYSAYLKKMPLVGNIVVAGLSAFVFVLLLLFEASFLNLITFDNANYALTILLLQLKFYACFAFITSLAREIVKDIEDREGDEQYNINTLAVQFGDGAAKIVAVIVLLALLTGVLSFITTFLAQHAAKSAAYLGTAVGVPVVAAIAMLFLAKQPKDYARISFLLKVIMLLGILSIPFFYYFKGQ